MASEIKTTTDYTIFKRLGGNRSVDSNRVNRITNSIQSVGWVTCPIIVNENMEVIDGQGRLQALERLGLPVEYVTVPGASLRQCQSMNASNTAWKNIDFIKSFAEAGSKSYQRILQIMTMYDIDVQTVLRLMNRRTSDDRYALQSGEIFISNDDFGKGLKRAPIYSAYMKAMKRFGGNAGTKKKVVFFLIEHGGYPHQQIIGVLTKCDPSEVYCTSDERLLECIENVYNKFKRDEQRIYFLADYRRK